jgi:two-component system, NtrC family, sensor kinase
MPDLAQATILLVDDSEENRYVLRRILERSDFKVTVASSGKEALELVARGPELVILDVKLPDMSGYDVCRRIKSNPATSRIPVLQISASFVSSESKAMALEGGADGYLTHPIESPVIIATVRSLLRLRRAEALSRYTAQQWQSTFDALVEAVAIVDHTGRLVRLNRSWAELCGIGANSDVQSCLESVIGASRMRAITEGMTELREDFQYRDRWLRLTITPVQDAEQVGAVIVIHDFTERVRAEEALRISERMAATGRLAHTIAHEINNPLEALTNLIYLAEKTAVREDVREYLNMATTELLRVARITKQVLSFNRDTSKQIVIDLTDLISTALDLHAVSISKKSVDVEYDPGPPLLVEGYPGELRQVLVNLIGNALEAIGDRGKITVRVKSVSVPHGKSAQITIHDTGPGIPGAIRQRVFEPFFTTKELKGSGLGLWLARGMIVKHHGSLTFKSRTGEFHGTTFRIVLPVVPDTLRDAATSRTQARLQVGSDLGPSAA